MGIARINRVERYRIDYTMEKPSGGWVSLILQSAALVNGLSHTLEVRFIRGYTSFVGVVSVSAGPRFNGLIYCGMEDFDRAYDLIRREAPIGVEIFYEGDEWLSLDPIDPSDRRLVTSWRLRTGSEPPGDGDADRTALLKALEQEMGATPPG